MKRQWLRTVAALSAAFTVCAAGRLHAQMAPSEDSDPRVVQGIGMASEQHKVSFESNSDGNNVIREVMVKPGDHVKKDDVLMVEDDAEARVQLATLKAESEAVGAIQEAQVTIDEKTKTVDKLTAAGANAGIAGIDIMNAQLEVDQAKAKRQQALEDQAVRKLEYARQQIKVDHMTLRSPIDGVVESVGLFAGEVVDANSDKNGACFVVSNDPLWVDVPVKASIAAKLKLHDKLDVAFADDREHWVSGQVIFLSSIAETVSQDQNIRLSIANPDNRPSGLPMLVRLPPPAPAAGAIGLAK